MRGLPPILLSLHLHILLYRSVSLGANVADQSKDDATLEPVLANTASAESRKTWHVADEDITETLMLLRSLSVSELC